MPTFLKNRMRNSPAVVAAFVVSVYLASGISWNLLAGALVRTFVHDPWARHLWRQYDQWAAILAMAVPLYLLIHHFIAWLRRIEEEKRASEHMLRKALQDVQSAMDNAAELTITDKDGAITYVNDRFCALSKFSREELLGQNHRALNSGQHSKEFFKALWDTILAGRIWQGNVCNKAKDGSLFWEATTITPILGPSGEPQQFVCLRHDITQLVRTTQELRESEENQRLSSEAAQIGTWSHDMVNSRVMWTPLAGKILGLGPDASASYENFIGSIHPDDRSTVEAVIKRGVDEHKPFTMEFRCPWPDGSLHWVSSAGKPYFDADGRLVRLAGVARDITETKRSQEKLAQTELQLRHAQKMEAVGRLAGGIAHDFNNLLTAITGYSHFLLNSLPDNDARRSDVLEIKKAGERAAALTRQLLAFSRRQVLEPTVLDLNALLADLDKMLRRIIGEQIELVFQPGADLGRVKADQGQIEQAIVNLAVNAKDSMPKGGRLVISTSNEQLGEEYLSAHPGGLPGRYVMIAISDTGCGMSEEVKAHLFEPFFTTKEPGKGTGLGLATVYGIVRQSQGSIYVYSEPGQGTVFKLYLPRADAVSSSDAKRAEEPCSCKGKETVLLVEDDELVHKFVARVLSENGYQVLAARSPAEAIELCARETAAIPLLLTDVVMPQMHGFELAKRLGKKRPAMKVIYMSGYTEQSLIEPAMRKGVSFLHKPLAADAMLRKVRSVLDASA